MLEGEDMEGAAQAAMEGAPAAEDSTEASTAASSGMLPVASPGVMVEAVGGMLGWEVVGEAAKAAVEESCLAPGAVTAMKD
jgi:hypothetical protein